MPTITQELASNMGIPHKTIQTIEIPRSWTLKQSREWLREHGYGWRYMRKTLNYRRFMQVFPITEAEYYSKKLPNGIIIVYQNY